VGCRIDAPVYVTFFMRIPLILATRFTQKSRSPAPQMSRIDENLHRILKDHGLTEYEIKTYLKLVFDGPATPFEISESVQIPYARVYGTLEGLEKRKWIRARPGRPVVYESNPPRSVAELELEQKQSEMVAFTNLMKQDLQAIYERREVVKNISLWVIHGGDKISEKIGEIVSTAKTRAYLQFATLIPKDVDDLRSSLKAARERGVSVKILSFVNPRFVDQKSLSLLSDNAEVGVIQEPNEESPKPYNVCAVDGRDTVLTYLWNIETPNEPGSRIAFRLSDEEFAGVMDRYFEYYWLKARRI
jgi:sugar-specific transcriptional regulator TrmB